MVHRCRVERNTATTPDSYGDEPTPVWVTQVASQPCYWYEQASGQGGEQRGVLNFTIYTHRLLLPLGVDVLETDRINGITDRLGVSLTTKTFNIKSIVRRPDHLLLVMEAVT